MWQENFADFAVLRVKPTHCICDHALHFKHSTIGLPSLDIAPQTHSTLSADAGVGSFLLDGVDDDVLFITATDGMVKVAVTIEVEVEVEVEEGRSGSTNSGGGGAGRRGELDVNAGE